MRTLYMETTKIEAIKTIGEIQEFLTAIGAIGFGIENDPVKREPVGFKFSLDVNQTTIIFALPARIEPIFNHLQLKRAVPNRNKKEVEDWQQARRVAWRQILQWVRAQFALIDTGMVKAEEVFLPYAIAGDNNQTLFQQIETKHFKGLLEAPK